VVVSRWPNSCDDRLGFCHCSNPSKGAILASKPPECGKCRIKSDWGGGIKLNDFTRAPNPRRVRIFLAEKGITVPMEQVDLFTGVNRTPAYSGVKCFVCCAASSMTGRRACSPSAEADPATIGFPVKFVSSPLVTYCGGSGAPCWSYLAE
jgi:hypothetical protein